MNIQVYFIVLSKSNQLYIININGVVGIYTTFWEVFDYGYQYLSTFGEPTLEMYNTYCQYFYESLRVLTLEKDFEFINVSYPII